MLSLWFVMMRLWYLFVCLLLLLLCVGVSCLVSGFVMMRLWCLFDFLFVITHIVCWFFMFSLWFCHDATMVFVCLFVCIFVSLLLLPLCVGVSC